MTRILYVTSSLAHDGTQTFIMNVYRKLDREKFRADFLLTNGKETDYSREVVQYGSKIYVTPSRKSGPVIFYLSLIRFFRQHHNDYQAIHFCYGSLTSIAALYLAYRFRIPVRIMHSHNSSVVGMHNKVLHWLHRPLVSRLVTHRLACSEKAGRFFFMSKPFTVMFNGIDVQLYSYSTEKRLKIRQELGIPEGCVVIGHVGRFVEVKNHSFILDVFVEYLKANNNARLLLVGVGELMDQMKEKTVRLGIDKNVTFMGLRLDVADLMQAMDCFLMPSLFEGLPFVIVEAQAAGLPCFISDVIDRGVDMTGNINFLPLKSSASEWANSIGSKLKQFRRTVTDNKIITAGYDISSTTQMLEAMYTSKKQNK